MASTAPHPHTIDSVRSHPGRALGVAGGLAAAALCVAALAVPGGSGGSGVEPGSQGESIVRPGTGQAAPTAADPAAAERMRRSAERFHHRR